MNITWAEAMNPLADDTIAVMFWSTFSVFAGQTTTQTTELDGDTLGALDETIPASLKSGAVNIDGVNYLLASSPAYSMLAC